MEDAEATGATDIATLYESIQQYCQSVSGISTGTYNGDMIAAAKAATGITRDMTANEAELLLLQTITGDLTDTLPGMHSRWGSILTHATTSDIIQEDGVSLILQEDGVSTLLVE